MILPFFVQAYGIIKELNMLIESTGELLIICVGCHEKERFLDCLQRIIYDVVPHGYMERHEDCLSSVNS
jgi:hypothetical protein